MLGSTSPHCPSGRGGHGCGLNWTLFIMVNCELKVTDFLSSSASSLYSASSDPLFSNINICKYYLKYKASFIVTTVQCVDSQLQSHLPPVLLFPGSIILSFCACSRASSQSSVCPWTTLWQGSSRAQSPRQRVSLSRRCWRWMILSSWTR